MGVLCAIPEPLHPGARLTGPLCASALPLRRSSRTSCATGASAGEKGTLLLLCATFHRLCFWTVSPLSDSTARALVFCALDFCRSPSPRHQEEVSRAAERAAMEAEEQESLRQEVAAARANAQAAQARRRPLLETPLCDDQR